ncbi:hypothetical protein BFP97_15905 [Roseivirga sp. 4D4]|uniref:PRC-barrel domain-containing protein n=1 Tax=Roseivirga sp. 4D4 TaxID=1889784 RepID=UPI000853CAD7|nr:PRC-barrel domain-containing protein [Roseivirga sp. 4D4]OEK02917.1 hypothetical protein BFP97_15905 [Roseivirga sp. 4D4]
MKNDNRLMTVEDLSNSYVVNAAHESIGSIKDIVVDVNQDKVAYAILSVSHTLGLGSKELPIPLACFKLDTREENKVILDVDKDRLLEAPAIDPTDWKDFNHIDLLMKVYAFYGVKPYVNQMQSNEPGENSDASSVTPNTFEEASFKTNKFDNHSNSIRDRHQSKHGFGS